MTSAAGALRLINYDIEDENLRPRQRRALLQLPDSHDGQKRLPLIIALHGKNQPPAEFADHTRFHEYGFEGLVALPEGIKLMWNGDPEAPPRREVDDITFINVLITKLLKEYEDMIDASKIYVAGFSNGGGLSALLASDHEASGRIAAFAMSSAAVYRDKSLKESLFSHRDPSRVPVPMLEFHGTADPVIHYDGKSTPDGETYEVFEYLQKWVSLNGLEEPAVQESLYGGKVTRFGWHQQGKETMIHYRIDGFGHGWPSTYPLNNDEQRHGPTYFDGSPVVLDFFKQWQLGGR